MTYFFIFGSHPELSQAELTSILTREHFSFSITSRRENFLLLETTTPLPDKFLTRLGGAIKYGEIIADSPSDKLQKTLFQILINHSGTGKIRFGLNAYNRETDLTKLGLTIKNALKDSGLTCRFVTSRESTLSSVVIHKNKLDQKDGFDFNLFYLDGRIQIGQTLAVQNFIFYSNIDYKRPAFDDKSGMLPPKVAQIMLNLLSDKTDSIYDPFCGSGTILMMAGLAGFSNLNGSDLSAKAVDDTITNLDWVRDRHQLNFTHTVKAADAAAISTNLKPNSISAIVTEPYLGLALTGRETPDELDHNISDLTQLYQTVFDQFASVLKTAGEIILILPEITLPRFRYRFSAENLIPKSLEILGHWVYSRPGQKVIRHIYKIVKVNKK
ncbi:TPA: hypothetical protein DF272_04345 [Candidatus Falkowbacteria bacterium]|nr:hypothetical protein [Candidatus Falkowbacteria bacterium]